MVMERNQSNGTIGADRRKTLIKEKKRPEDVQSQATGSSLKKELEKDTKKDRVLTFRDMSQLSYFNNKSHLGRRDSENN